MDIRPSGDGDLHVVLWGLASLTWWWSIRSPRRTLQALGLLVVWATVVETLQPMFTEIRERQLGDYVANSVGVGMIALVVVIRWSYFDGPMSPAT